MIKEWIQHFKKEPNISNNFIPPKIKRGIKVIIVTDLHGTGKRIEDSTLQDLFIEYDVCFLLGDNDSSDLEKILPYLDLSKTYGIYGNHDDYRDQLYEKYYIENIHGKQIFVKGCSFVGWEGSFKYKPSAIGMTQEESIVFEKTLPETDFLISHDGPFQQQCNNPPHAGLKGISNYQARTGCFVLRGHLHNRYETNQEHCFYKIEKIVL